MCYMAEKNRNTLDWIKFAIYIITMVVSLTLAYGVLDRRVTILEVTQERKVDGEQLQLLLKQWKDEIIQEIRREVKQKIKNKEIPNE